MFILRLDPKTLSQHLVQQPDRHAINVREDFALLCFQIFATADIFGGFGLTPKESIFLIFEFYELDRIDFRGIWLRWRRSTILSVIVTAGILGNSSRIFSPGITSFLMLSRFACRLIYDHEGICILYPRTFQAVSIFYETDLWIPLSLLRRL